MEILQLIEHKLTKFGIAFDPQDAEINLGEVDQAIKNYCHIDCIPQELLYVRVNMVVDYIRYIEGNKPAENGANVSDVKVGPLTSIKSGNVSYNFADTTNSKGAIHNAHAVDLDAIVTNYTYQLNAFRRLP